MAVDLYLPKLLRVHNAMMKYVFLIARCHCLLCVCMCLCIRQIYNQARACLLLVCLLVSNE